MKAKAGKLRSGEETVVGVEKPLRDGNGVEKSRAWLVYLLAGLLAMGVYFFVLPTETAQDAFYCVFSASSLVAVVAGLRLHRPERPLLWYLFGAYVAALFVGDAIYQSFLVFAGIEFPYPSIADVFFLLAYLPLIWGLLLMTRRHAPGSDRRGLLDALIITAGVGTLAWVFFLGPYAKDDSLSLTERVVSMVYLLVALLTFAVLVRFMIAFRDQVAAYRFLSISILAFVVADMIYGAQSLTGLYEAGGAVDTGWFVSYVFFGVAALHPSMRALSEPVSSIGEHRITWRRLMLFAGASLLAPLMILVEVMRGEYGDVQVLAGMWAVLILLVLFRMEGLVRMLKAASERYGRSAAREEVLRKAGASLVVAPTREDVYQAALGAVLELVDDEEVRVYVGAGTTEEITIVAAAGREGTEVKGLRIYLEKLPKSLRQALAEGVSLEARGADARQIREYLGFETGSGGILVSPLIHEEGFMGVLVAATDSPAFDEETRDGFEALGSQVSLALEGAILAERIHRRKDEERFGALIQNSSDIITVVNEKGFILYQSPSLQRVLGYETGERNGKNIFGPASAIHPEDVAEQRGAFVRAVEHPRDGATTELRRRHRDGSWRWLQEIYTSLLDDPEVGGVVINARDVTERKRSEQKLREAHQRLGSHVENSPVGVVEWDKDLRVLRWSQEAERIFGWNAGEVVGERLSDLRFIHEDDEEEASKVIFRLLSGTERRVMFQNRNYRKDGSVVYCEWYNSALVDESGELLSVMSLALDVTGRKELEEELEHQALHDPLTGLANRTLFADRVGDVLSRDDRGTNSLAVMLLDLDDFKEINDNLGHAGGDEVLREVARRLLSCLRSGDTAARLGGDEFAVLVENAAGTAGFVRVAERIMEAFDAPFLLEEGELHIHASLGIAVGEAEETVDDLLYKADVAMYASKGRNKGGYELFDPSMHAATLERLALKADLQRAIERREFTVHYQPIVDVSSGAVCEVEALVRWEHLVEGLVPPDKFIPLAEETGLIVPLGKLVLAEACRRVEAWRARYPHKAALTLSVNLSARQFQRSNLVDDVREVLSKTGLPPERLKLEITESVAMEDVEATLETLRKLKSLGVKLAIDDFGTGYSSLAYLERFPVDTLKIDRSFVDRLGEDPESSAIVATTISLARILDLTVTAEGVETAGQLVRLDELGCDLAQGYYFSKPLPAVSMVEFLAASRFGSRRA